jgi:SAM-dependent methyltransferase
MPRLLSRFKRSLNVLREDGIRVFLHRLAYRLRGRQGHPPMLLAYRYCRGQGIELGAAAYNPFHLKHCRNVAPYSDDPESSAFKDYELYKQHQIEVIGHYTPVDLPGDAINIPVEDNSLDYVLSSHVVEHLPDPIRAFLEWNRVLKSGGVVFMIFPKREALANDAKRPITPLAEFIDDYHKQSTIETHPIAPGDRVGGHYHVFTLESMLELIAWCNDHLNLGWVVVETEATDSKIGNGHTVVCRYEPSEPE